MIPDCSLGHKAWLCHVDQAVDYVQYWVLAPFGKHVAKIPIMCIRHGGGRRRTRIIFQKGLDYRERRSELLHEATVVGKGAHDEVGLSIKVRPVRMENLG